MAGHTSLISLWNFRCPVLACPNERIRLAFMLAYAQQLEAKCSECHIAWAQLACFKQLLNGLMARNRPGV